jgi:signal peptidase I
MNVRGKKSNVRENVQAVLLALIAALCLRTFVFENYMVPTGFVFPTIGIGDRLVAVKFVYGAKIPFTGARTPGRAQARAWRHRRVPVAVLQDSQRSPEGSRSARFHPVPRVHEPRSSAEV